MDTQIFAVLEGKMQKGRIKACIVMHNNAVLFRFSKNRKVDTILHPVHSCTKSVVSALIGICLRNRLLSDIDVPLTEFFGDCLRAQQDARKRSITIRHLLTMTPGFHWPEFGEWNFGSPMEYSKDIVRFILDRDLEDAPGTRMNYNSGCSHLLSAIVQSVSGMRAADFARRHLFAPLGIDENTVWHEKQGVSLGANGLKMFPLDMARFGTLYLRHGTVDGREIVTREWVEESTRPRFLTYPDIGWYGYHWWSGSFDAVDYYFAMGLFGQFVIVLPVLDTVVVFVSENYSDTLQPLRYLHEDILPNIPRRFSADPAGQC